MSPHPVDIFNKLLSGVTSDCKKRMNDEASAFILMPTPAQRGIIKAQRKMQKKENMMPMNMISGYPNFINRIQYLENFLYSSYSVIVQNFSLSSFLFSFITELGFVLDDKILP